MGIARLQLRQLSKVSWIDAGIAECDPAIAVDPGERVEDVGEVRRGKVGYARPFAVNTP
jgi:hypothetical protein